MLVRSEDREVLRKVNAITVETCIDQSGWWLEDEEGNVLSEHKTREEALARLDDVQEWANAPAGEWDIETDEWTPKPKVYEFAREIGFWKRGA